MCGRKVKKNIYGTEVKAKLYFAVYLTHLDTMLAEWKRSPCLSSAMTRSRLFEENRSQQDVTPKLI